MITIFYKDGTCKNYYAEGPIIKSMGLDYVMFEFVGHDVEYEGNVGKVTLYIGLGIVDEFIVVDRKE